MIRFFTLVGIMVAVAAAAGLYRVKLRTAELADKVIAIDREIDREGEAITVLRAEWSLLNQPDRLQHLAERFTPLTPIAIDQVVRVGGLSDYLENPVTGRRQAPVQPSATLSYRVGQQ